MAEMMKFEIVTPEGSAYSADVEMVTLTGVEGEMGILPQHARLMTRLMPGELVVRKAGREQYLAVGEGLVDITRDRVSILTDMAVAAESIDEAKAEEARKRAEARLREQLSAAEVASTSAALARSLAQLRVKRRRRGFGDTLIMPTCREDGTVHAHRAPGSPSTTEVMEVILHATAVLPGRCDDEWRSCPAPPARP